MPLCEDLQKLFSKQVSLDYTFKINQFDFGVNSKASVHKPIMKDSPKQEVPMPESMIKSSRSSEKGKKVTSHIKQSYFDLISAN